MKLNTFEIYGVLTLAEFWGSSICLMTGGFNWLFAMLFSAQLSIPHLQIHKLRWSTHNYLRRLLRKMAWINWGSGSATIECNVYPCTCNGTLYYNGEKSHQFFQVYRISLLPSQFYDHYYSFFGTEFLKIIDKKRCPPNSGIFQVHALLSFLSYVPSIFVIRERELQNYRWL